VTPRPYRTLAASVLALSMLAGCNPLSPQPDPTRFYVLTPIAGSAQSVVDTANTTMTIGLGPVNLPDYLDQQWMVSRGAGNQLYVSSHDQWGEPLRDSFNQVLKQDLAQALNQNQIIDYPWYRTAAVDRQITVDLIDFAFNTSTNSAEIRADWSVLNARTASLESRGQFVAAQSVPPDASAQVRAAALSKLVGDLAQTLAQQVRRVPTIAQGGSSPADHALLGDSR
jgi:uncharacterized lipoprotein YmbA